MARKPMVTRKFLVTRCVLMMVDVTTGEVYNDATTITRAPKNEEKLMAIVRKKVEDDEHKVVAIVDKKMKIQHRAQEEDFYIENSEVVLEEDYVESEENN